MSNSKFKEFARVEELFDNGELDNAYQVLIESIPYSELNLQQKYHFHLIKGLILFFQSRTEELIKLGKQIFNDGQLQNDTLQSLDGIFFILLGRVGSDFKVDEEVFTYFEQSNKLLEQLNTISKIEFKRREARLNLLKLMTYLILGDLDIADKHITLLLNAEKDLKHTFERVWIYILLARRMLQGKIKYDHALNYTQKALSLAENIRFNHFWVAICHVGISAVKYVIGEFEESLKHSLKSVTIYKKINNKSYIAMTLNNIGGLYAEIGDYDNALKYLEESLSLWKQGLPAIETVLDSIITAAVNKGDITLARKYFKQLKELHFQLKTPIIVLLYKYNKALMLKNSTRIRDKAEAENLFKRVAETDLMAFDIKIKALIHLCDLFLAEYRLNQDPEVLDELDSFITKLLEFAEKSHSYLIFCETFILQAKISLLKFETKTARRYLTNAQKIAESHGMKRLAIQISYEHDILLDQLMKWQKFQHSKIPLSKKIELARINEQMEHMVKKSQIKIPEPEDEESIILLITSEGGVPFFSQSFVSEKFFEDHLIAGFLSAINSFINETFSEGLDRASFGNYTLLMRSIKPFLIFYIYKGNSYSAQDRIRTFLDELKNNRELWNNFNHLYEMNQEIKINDIPSFEPLVTKIFVDKR